MKHRSYKRVIGALVIIILALITIILGETIRISGESVIKEVEPKYTETIIRPKVIEPITEISLIDITLTRYYPNDSTGSDKCTATKCTSDFEVNDKGWFTYQGKVVMATATYACQKYCKNRAKYGPLPSDYRIYNFYDEIQFELEGAKYTGIVLDSCGACMWNINGEKIQRYDIYTPSGKTNSSLIQGKNVGKTSAKLVLD